MERLERAGVRISMNGRGRVFDNIFVERLWRSVKYEDVYLKDYASVSDARENLTKYFRFYNERRPHQALGWRTPAEVYFDNREVIGGSDANSAVPTVGLRPPPLRQTNQNPSTLV
ncbi:transposase [bacterium]|nr:transposase [bacterium]